MCMYSVRGSLGLIIMLSMNDCVNCANTSWAPSHLTLISNQQWSSNHFVGHNCCPLLLGRLKVLRWTNLNLRANWNRARQAHEDRCREQLSWCCWLGYFGAVDCVLRVCSGSAAALFVKVTAELKVQSYPSDSSAWHFVENHAAGRHWNQTPCSDGTAATWPDFAPTSPRWGLRSVLSLHIQPHKWAERSDVQFRTMQWALELWNWVLIMVW